MATDTMPDLAILLEAFLYDPETGELWWRERPLHHFKNSDYQGRWNRRRAGTQAGYTEPDRYSFVALFNKHHYVHRIIFKLMTGRAPAVEIDHINCQKSDNRWINLREATKSQNSGNVRVAKRSKTGIKGVVLEQRTGKFIAYFTVGRRGRRLGAFPTKEEAHAAYCEAARQHFGEFWNPG